MEVSVTQKRWYYLATIIIIMCTINERSCQTKKKTKPRVTGKEKLVGKDHVYNLLAELVKDCDNKMKRADGIKAFYQRTGSAHFEAGLLLSTLDSEYRKMMTLYRQCKEHVVSKNSYEMLDCYDQMQQLSLSSSYHIDVVKTLPKRPVRVRIPPGMFTRAGANETVVKKEPKWKGNAAAESRRMMKEKKRLDYVDFDVPEVDEPFY